MEGCSLPAQKPGEGRKKQPEEEFPGFQRRWYYNIFLLDPAISKKEVHNKSLEKASTENSISRGWVTKWKVGELEGANPQAHDFEELCDGAVEGLEWKEHPNQSWMEVEKVKNQSLTKSKQSVELDADHFAEVESRLQPKARR